MQQLTVRFPDGQSFDLATIERSLQQWKEALIIARQCTDTPAEDLAELEQGFITIHKALVLAGNAAVESGQRIKQASGCRFDRFGAKPTQRNLDKAWAEFSQGQGIIERGQQALNLARDVWAEYEAARRGWGRR